MKRYSSPFYGYSASMLDTSNFYAKVKFDLDIKRINDDYIFNTYDLGFKKIYSDGRGCTEIMEYIFKIVRHEFDPDYWFSLRMSITTDFRAFNPKINYYSPYRNSRENFLTIRSILNDMQYDFTKFVQDLRDEQKEAFKKQQKLLSKGFKVVMVMDKNPKNS